ncbi:MAG: ATP-binding protein [Spirochaetia bacterium]|nr:ATP-binding protein [Spirochaetia bacterium]
MLTDKFIENRLVYFIEYFKVIAFVTLISLLIFSSDIYIKFSHALKTIELKDEFFINAKKNQLEQFMESLLSDLKQLKENENIKNYLKFKNSDYLESASVEFVSLAAATKIYDEIILIDKTGQEKIHITNYDEILRLRGANLQNVSNENYFIQTERLSNGGIFVSNVELNQNRGKVEIPYRPVVRFATVLYNQFDAPSGILLIRIDGNKFIEKFMNKNLEFPGRLMIVSGNGSWAFGDSLNTDLSVVLQENKKNEIKKILADEWSLIAEKNEGKFKSENGSFVFKTLYSPINFRNDHLENISQYSSSTQAWKIIAYIPQEYIRQMFKNIIMDEIPYVIIYFIIALITGLYFAYLFAGKKINNTELTISETTLKNAQKILKTGNWYFNLIERKWYWSDELYHIFGYDPNNNQPDLNLILKIVHPDDLSRVTESMKSALEKHVEHQITFDLLLPGGKIKHVISIISLENVGGLTEKIHGVIQDITSHINIESELRLKTAAIKRSNDVKMEFIINIVNEIKSSINIIAGFSSSLSSQVNDKISMYFLKSINVTSKILLKLFNDIVILSDLESESENSNVRPVNLLALINESKELFRLRLQEKKLKFFLEIDPKLPEQLLVDEVRVRQIFISLIGNAIKFTDQGFILITVKKKFSDTEHRNVDISIIVEDTGIGLSESNKTELLKRLLIAEKNNKDITEQGFGLSITRRLLNLMNGEMIIKNQPDRGTIVKITIPSVKIVSGQKSEIKSEYIDNYIENISLDDFSKSVILLISNSNEKQLIKNYFLDGPIEIAEAANNKESIEMIEYFLPNVVIALPDKENFEELLFVKNIRKNEKYADIPFILLLPEKLRSEKGVINLTKAVNEVIYTPMEKNELMLSLARYLPFQDSSTDRNMIINLGGLTDKDKKDMTELLSILQNRMKYMWEKVSNLLEKPDIEEFAAEITELARNYNYRPLFKWANDLSSQVHMFDAISILNTLKEFPHIVDSLKKQNL